MNDKQLNTIMWAVANSTMVSDGNTLEHINAGWADLSAMRTPITAEALLAAGWHKEEYGIFDQYSHRSGVSVAIDKIDQKVSVYIGASESWDDVMVTGCATMYDLGELVRLLGGAA